MNFGFCWRLSYFRTVSGFLSSAFGLCLIKIDPTQLASAAVYGRPLFGCDVTVHPGVNFAV
jgi:hypothetical protein